MDELLQLVQINGVGLLVHIIDSLIYYRYINFRAFKKVKTSFKWSIIIDLTSIS